MSSYDTIIIGGGPAGLSAGIYAMRSRLSTLLIEKLMPGGQMVVIDFIENYPGFPGGISGSEFAERMERQARELGLEFVYKQVISVDFSGSEKRVICEDEEFQAAAVIIAVGSTPRRLGVPGEDRLLGKGVSYCATCDGALFRDKDIAVVGGGNTAIQDAVFLSRFATSVTVIHRRDELRATKILQERAFANPKIRFIWNSVVGEIQGENKVESLRIRNVEDDTWSEFPVDGVFVLIGADSNTECVRGHVALDGDGSVITDEDMRTSTPGVFAAGDCRRKAVRQIVTAAADGAVAALSAEKYIEALGDERRSRRSL